MAGLAVQLANDLDRASGTHADAPRKTGTAQAPWRHMAHKSDTWEAVDLCDERHLCHSILEDTRSLGVSSSLFLKLGDGRAL